MHKAKTASQVIIEEVSSWEGVELGPGRFGAVQFRLGKRELGHLHGDRLADIPFPRALRDRLVAEGTVVPHRPLPDSGWASRHIRSEDDVRAVIDLLRMQYDRAMSQRSSRSRLMENNGNPAS
jgi:luciferase-like monooxygenase